MWSSQYPLDKFVLDNDDDAENQYLPPDLAKHGLRHLNIIDINVLVTVATSVLVELNVVLDTLVTICVCLVDLGTFWQFSVGLQRSSLVGRVFQYHIALLVLVVSQGEEDDVSLVDPDLLSQFASNMCKSLFTVEAESFQSAVTQHFEDLGIFLTFLLEGQFSFLVVVFVLSSTTIFTTL